ncbi:MAG: MBL fold metallo-hydrolase [Bacilli bacterium]|nr:MBL fold metallo-hydrolase [Bacilli bacterium]
MKVCILASGSKGNCAYIETDKTRSLVDLGMSASYISKSLKNIGVDPFSIQRVFITHTHSDHVAGLKVFIKKYHPIIYLTEKMDNELDFDIEDKVYIDKTTVIDDLMVDVFKTSHDVADSNGYVFESNGKSVVYVTDTGYIHVKNFNKLRNKNMYVFESNHDVRMLKEGRYPYHLQQRILGDKGHLSNKDSAYYLSKLIGDKTKKIILIHLSEENNKPEIALKTLLDTLNKNDLPIPDIEIACQKESTELEVL